ncbi:hypothetical protein SY88_14395 [Clostridiales bacterium PH28_bin88]|nr:hypothetical protein SY88_14395 [Clostridiales bacterium PH28_bin88]
MMPRNKTTNGEERRGLAIKKLSILLVTFLALALMSTAALASPAFVGELPADKASLSCSACHASAIPALNDSGKAFKANGNKWPAAKPAPAPAPKAPAKEAAPAAPPKTTPAKGVLVKDFADVLGSYGYTVTVDNGNAVLTREQAAAMLVQAIGLKTGDADASVLKKFKDANKVSKDLEKAVAVAVKEGLFVGYGKTFGFKDTMTEKQVLAIRWRIEARPPANLLQAVKTSKAPVLDGISEDLWNAAQEYKVEVLNGGVLQGSGGNFEDGKTEVAIKALYDSENLYMRFRWADPTESLARGPWIKENGQLVKKDYSEFYEDKFAVNWNIAGSVANFDTQGCAATCHVSSAKDKKGNPIIKHWTNAENEKLDMWHWKLTRQNNLYGPDKPGLMHDQYMDNIIFDPADDKTKSAGRHADPGEKEYVDNATGKSPEWGVPKLVLDGPTVNGNPYVIVDGLDKTKPFTEEYLNSMKDGDFLPGLIAKQISGDPADIKAKGKWENGFWTLEIQRKLVNGSAYDVQFDDLTKTYFFAVAAFDNSQIGHAYQQGVIQLKFAK